MVINVMYDFIDFSHGTLVRKSPLFHGEREFDLYTSVHQYNYAETKVIWTDNLKQKSTMHQ